MRIRARLAATVLAVTGLLASCSSGSSGSSEEAGGPQPAKSAAPSPSRADFDRYVALGDSFTAGPLIPITDVAGGCFRSDHNYPSLVAEQLDVKKLVDVSCSGADTADLTGRQQTVQGASVRPQLRALTPGTDLVTLGIGGNDFDLFQTLVVSCSQLRGQDPTGSPCSDELRRRGIDLLADTRRIADRVTASIREIEDRAPSARILLVGYPRLAPTTGGCPKLPFARGDYELGVRISRALDDALTRAARRTGVGFVDLYAASKGHDVCSDDPWVNGSRTIRGKALAFHPFVEGMDAAADQVVTALSKQGG